jgi:DNA polymerase (family 10)
MDNLGIARILDEIADLLEIKAENPFKIRAYRNAGSAIRDSAAQLADLSREQILGIPGIGKDIGAKIQELLESGVSRYHQTLLEEFPPTILDLLGLQGVGPKTVALLYRSLGIRTLEDLESAAALGKLRGVKGMGPRKEALILKAIEERRRFAGRHLLADADEVAAAVVAHLRTRAPEAEIEVVGSLRRGCETCGDLDILASGGGPELMEDFCRYHLVERVLAHGETKSSVLFRGGLQADLRLVARDSRGAALQYFTGSKAHNIALRDRAVDRGFKLNEYGLFDLTTEGRVAGDTEEGIYEALGLAWVPPELREHRGEIAAAEARELPRLIELTDLRGDLHVHTTETDGRDDIETMARAAGAIGLTYLAITDHTQSLAMANGLDEHRALLHAGRIRELNARLDGITLLAGVECDIRSDGTLDLSHDCLAQLDIVIASVHSRFNQDEAEMTDRLLRALECPFVDVLGHPTGRMILRREPYRMNLDLVIDAAARQGVALEINGQAHRLDLNDVNARLARERGAALVISSDAHAAGALRTLRWGLTVARRAWLEPRHVLNTLPVEALRAGLRRNRKGK